DLRRERDTSLLRRQLFVPDANRGSQNDRACLLLARTGLLAPQPVDSGQLVQPFVRRVRTRSVMGQAGESVGQPQPVAHALVDVGAFIPPREARLVDRGAREERQCVVPPTALGRFRTRGSASMVFANGARSSGVNCARCLDQSSGTSTIELQRTATVR